MTKILDYVTTAVKKEKKPPQCSKDTDKRKPSSLKGGKKSLEPLSIQEQQQGEGMP